MGRTVLGRLTATHLLVAIAATLLAACLGSLLFSRHYTHQRLTELQTATERLARTAAEPLAAGDNPQLSLLVKAAGDTLGGRVCVLSASDTRLAAREGGVGPVLDPSLSQKLLTNASHDAKVEIVEVACPPGLTYTLTCPVLGARSEVLGLVVVRSPLGDVRRIVRAQWASAALAALLAGLLAVGLAFVLAQRLAQPLGTMARAAEALAEGRFETRLTPTGPRELAALAAAINRSSERLRELFGELSDERSKLADVLASMAEGVLAYDPDGTILLANARAHELLDLPDELVGRRLAELLSDTAALAAFDSPASDPFTLGTRQLRVGTAPLTSGAGRVAVVLDVSQSERLEHMRREFVANASHQLRTPLTSLKGYLEAVRDGTAETPEEQRRCLDVAADQVLFLQHLVDRLLELSRLQAGAGDEIRQPVDLRAVADRAIQHFGPPAQTARVTLAPDLPDHPAIVSGDPERLLKALHNLVDNALRHAPAGSTVTVRVEIDAQQAVLTVVDEGPGLNLAEAEQLWERFRSGRSTGAAGLGLAICREIVQAHGGQVTADNQPSGGAVFGFRLPLAPAAPPVPRRP